MVIDPLTQKTLDQYGQSIPQALIISGPVGVGLNGVMNLFSERLKAVVITVLPERNEKVDIEKGTITVESIRRLYDQTKTKTTQPRIIAIDYAERMGVQAQNAFLKLLEEPPYQTYFMLLAHSTKTLLPTILSRTQEIHVRPVSRQQSETLLDSLRVIDPTKRAQLLFIAEGLPAELSRLAKDEAYFTQRAEVVRDARTYIQGTAYDSFKIIQKYKDSREQSLLLLTDAMRFLEDSLIKQPHQQTIQKLDTLLHAHEMLLVNGNVRLQLASHVV